jgi:CRP/FNR family cyclic AMP-dependent transcriptional regulator
VRSSTTNVDELFARAPLFKGLSDADRQALARQLVRRAYNKSQVIFQMGAPGDEMFFIQSGSVKVELTSEHGQERLLAVLYAGDFFGELTLIDGEPRSAETRADEECVLQVLPRQAFLDFIRTRPDAALHVMQVLSRRLRQTDILMYDSAFLDVTGRLASTLVRLADDPTLRDPGGTPGLITRGFTHDELATMISARREGVTIALATFERQKLISRESRHRIRVLNREGLLRRAN